MQIDVSPQLATLIVGLLTLVTAIVTAVVTSWLTRRREDRSQERQARLDKATKTQAFYEEAITVINLQIENLCMADAAFGERLHAIKAKMALLPRRDIETLFYETGELVDQWAASQRKANPRPIGHGVVIVEASSVTEKHRIEAQRLFPLMIEKFDQLKREMAEHLEEIEAPQSRALPGARKPLP